MSLTQCVFAFALNNPHSITPGALGGLTTQHDAVLAITAKTYVNLAPIDDAIANMFLTPKSALKCSRLPDCWDLWEWQHVQAAVCGCIINTARKGGSRARGEEEEAGVNRAAIAG